MADEILFTNIAASDNMADLDVMNGHEVPLTDLQQLEPSCLLIFIIAGKVVMNIFIFGARHRNVTASFLGYFCISLAAMDFALLLVIASIHYFQDFSVVGVRFTSYHICLFTQIVSHTYGILHFPVLLASGLDYYLTIVKSIKISWICSGLVYTVSVLLLWMMAFIYVLQSHVKNPAVESYDSAYLCTFYISRQSFYLSAALVFTLFSVLAVCCWEIVSFIKSLKVVSYANSTVVLFSFPSGDQWPIQGQKRFLASLLFSFLGTWGPFVVLQVIIFALCAHIPAYMDMNVPWLYFMNSFLIAVCLALKYPDLPVTEKTFSTDPFIGWKYCALPFMDADLNKGISLLPSAVTIV
ncbi:PREDICTED: probable G-protein coupled receptor 160 [Nanorana parkeri]|uniref:probable G-protein coupled receptor 160 n=1 Tax=Nanorana parkeri TaxID=125878 RepID=UPI000854CB65|nr:PREDICTED: probable G-protein coupled receptor 160 [Nanorana parkeri]